MAKKVLLILFISLAACWRCSSAEEFAPGLDAENISALEACAKSGNAAKADACLMDIAGAETENRALLSELYALKGEIWYLCFNFERAADDYAKAIENAETDKQKANAYYYHADALAGECRYDEALDDYNKAIEILPDGEEKPYVNRGIVNIYLGKSDDALDDFSKMIEIRGAPNDYMNMAQLYLSRGDSKNTAKYTKLTQKAYKGIPEDERQGMEPDLGAMIILEEWFKKDDDHLPTQDSLDMTLDIIQEAGDKTCEITLPVLLLKYYSDFSNADAVYSIGACYAQQGDTINAMQYFHRYLCISNNEKKKSKLRELLADAARQNERCAED